MEIRSNANYRIYSNNLRAWTSKCVSTKQAGGYEDKKDFSSPRVKEKPKHAYSYKWQNMNNRKLYIIIAPKMKSLKLL